MELNQCINAANDLLRPSDEAKAELVVALINRAFALGKEEANRKIIDAIRDRMPRL